MSLWLAGIIVLALNLPFGYWRKTLRKFSWRWFLSIHAPVPIVVAIRLLGGLGWHPLTFVVLVGAFAAGQFLGGMLELIKKPNVIG